MTDADKIAAARAMIEPLTGQTRGKWRVSLPNDTVVISPDGFAVAHMAGDYCLPTRWPAMEANARLIAAAPTLRDTVAALADIAEAQAQEIVLVCDGCVTTKTDAEINAWVAEHPDARRSCCPERKMRPITRADWDAQARRIAELEAALRLHKAWADSEDAGPDYGGQTRDTHPDGERIWRNWWNWNLDLCARAQAATDAALGDAP